MTAPLADTPSESLPPQPGAERLDMGVDGGGTKTAVWIARTSHAHDGIVIGKGMSGSSNVRAVGERAAEQSLADAIADAWRNAREPQQRVDHAVLALAGAGQPEIKRQWLHWATERQVADRTTIVHDADAVLAAGAPHGFGAALIAGTGSSAVGVSATGHRCVVGGWGWRWGDEGGAYWIGREALHAVGHAADGRSEPTRLTEAFCAHWNASTPRALLAHVESTPDVRRAMADLAPIVAKVAQLGDGAALAIMHCAALALADLVATVAHQMEWHEAFPLALAGGVLTQSTLVAEPMVAELLARGLRPAPIAYVPDPVVGCLRLARSPGILPGT